MAMLLMLALSAALTACSDDDDDDNGGSITRDQLVGNWVLNYNGSMFMGVWRRQMRQYSRKSVIFAETKRNEAMTENNERYYPVGVQTFREIINGGYVYVDKTEYIYRLLAAKTKYAFLSRPRRFGKSLLVSTFHEYFAGNRELFKGLYIDSWEKEWKKHPVLHFDLSDVKSDKIEKVEEALDKQLRYHEDIYGRDEHDVSPNTRLKGLIQRAYEQTGKQVVLLIDEYDAPMMEALSDEEAFNKVRRLMRNFFSPIKSCDPYLRFTFLTGITKFAQMSIFSELNNLLNISMSPQFAGICGITKEELDTVLAPDVDLLAEKMEESREAVREELRLRYDGYHFSHNSPDVFNPYSLLSSFRTGEIEDYWFGSGTPGFLVEMIRKLPTGMMDISGQWVDKSSFDVAAERPSDLLPLLYQTGYLTIKGYNRMEKQYLLGMPNIEVRTGLTRNLIEGYVDSYDNANSSVRVMRDCIRRDDLDGAFRALRDFLAAKPYLEQAHMNEAYFQDMLFVIFTMLGCWVDMEVRLARGRIDMVLYRPGRIYVMELKVDVAPEEAIRCIDDREYAARFHARTERIVRVGISFSTAERNLAGWLIAE